MAAKYTFGKKVSNGIVKSKMHPKPKKSGRKSK
nr:MAG TPA: hypothetical protein [Caudoviricetes sp.]